MQKLYEYEKAVSPEKRTELGIVYTPPEIVSFINESVLSLWDKDHPPKFIDPCCGTGVFLMDMVQKVSERYNIPVDIVYRDYAFGIDLDGEAISVALSAMPHANLYNRDSLNEDLSEYDVIITHPPYIRIQNLDELVRKDLKDNFEFCKGDTDLYMAFLEKIAKTNKISGMIFPNSWLKNKNADNARSFVSCSSRASTLIDFRSKKVFDNASTYTNILILSDREVENIKVGNNLDSLTVVETSQVFVGDLVVTSIDDMKYAKEVATREHRFLDVVDIKTGLATLADDVFCLELVSKGQKYSSVKKRGKKHKEVFQIENDMLAPCIRAGDITKNLTKKYVMIFPYKNQKPIPTQHIRAKFPELYNFLEKNKERLLQRDKGKDKGYNWTEFGRTQALGLKNKDKIVFSTMVSDKMSLKDSAPGTVFVSGYCFMPKSNLLDGQALRRVLTSDDLLRWVKIFGKDFGNEWRGISKQTFKNYKINLDNLINT